MATYEARLATFVKHGWRGRDQPETLAKYGFRIVFLDELYDRREASCISCDELYFDLQDDDDEWILSHRNDCPFRQAALREDSSAQLIVRKQQKVREQKRLPEKPKPAQDQTADDLRQQIQTLQRQVDTLKRQKQAMEKELEEKRALEKEVEEYASVKAALRAALGL